MPEYQFYCQHCERPFSLIFKTIPAYASASMSCPRCMSREIRRRIGRISQLKSGSRNSQQSALEADPALLAAIDPDNPRELGRLMQTMGAESGMEMGDQFNEISDRLQKGQTPQQIETDLPHLKEND